MALAVKKEYASSFRGRTFESDLLDLMVESGRNGENCHFVLLLSLFVYIVYDLKYCCFPSHREK